MGANAAWRPSAGAVPVAALGLRADLRVAVDDDTIGALVEGQRAANRLALALVDDLHRRAGHHVRLVGRRVYPLAALRLAALLAQDDALVRLGAIQFVAGWLEEQVDAGRGHVAVG